MSRLRLIFEAKGAISVAIDNLSLVGSLCRSISTDDASLVGNSIITPTSVEYSWCCSDDAAVKPSVAISLLPQVESRCVRRAANRPTPALTCAAVAA